MTVDHLEEPGHDFQRETLLLRFSKMYVFAVGAPQVDLHYDRQWTDLWTASISESHTKIILMVILKHQQPQPGITYQRPVTNSTY